tara:strand:+ start:31 stop:195 length:165 start_codon:yes stop_codon:yes gene_type:complete
MANKYKPFWSAQLNKELLSKLTIDELEKLGRKNGVEVDKRFKKESIVDLVYAAL